MQFLSVRRDLAVALTTVLVACTSPTDNNEGVFPPLLVLPPPCDNPAPLRGSPNPAAPRYIVVFHDTIDTRAEVDRLAARYGFQPRHVYEYVLGGFSAPLPPQTVAALRCEPSVRYVQHVGPGYMLG
jgi:hypothetical protein